MKTQFFGRIWLGLIMTAALMLAPAAEISAEQLAKEQVARLAVGVNDIGTVDPHFAVKIGESPIVRMVYESLLRHPPGEINIEKIEPSLAERWEVAADKLTWTFYLRKGVQWHENYGEFTAE
ncbi:MAG: ABC transporter substrate-binding protein, partial [Desulfobacterales bacterium]